jgi:hypothetical protein
VGEIPVAVEAELARLRAENARLLKLLIAQMLEAFDDARDLATFLGRAGVPGFADEFLRRMASPLHGI